MSKKMAAGMIKAVSVGHTGFKSGSVVSAVRVRGGFTIMTARRGIKRVSTRAFARDFLRLPIPTRVIKEAHLICAVYASEVNDPIWADGETTAASAIGASQQAALLAGAMSSMLWLRGASVARAFAEAARRLEERDIPW